MRVGFKAVLVSPHFLFLREKPGKLDDFALASRLSYFLWSSMPDEELLTLAEQGQAARTGRAPQQVERCSKDPKAAAFTENFVGQWLGLRDIDATAPDPALYPEFDDMLKVSMVQETLAVLRRGAEERPEPDELRGLRLHHAQRPAGEALRHPRRERPGVPQGHAAAGQPPRRRADDGQRAEGDRQRHHHLAGHARAPGCWTASWGRRRPNRTVDVEAVEPDIRGATTIREQLAKHRQRAECASCHAKIDPPGFALESFDVIGGWRDNYRSVGKGEPVVVNGRTMRYKKGPDGGSRRRDAGRPAKFKNIDEFKQLLLKDKDQLARALAEKLLTYATGGHAAKADQPEIEAIVARIRARRITASERSCTRSCRASCFRTSSCRRASFQLAAVTAG